MRGPNIASGYWNRPEETNAAFCRGWFKSGDIARQDRDGFYSLVDRKKDMFISGGENVYPGEIENILIEAEFIAEVVVIGIQDDRWGEVGCAYIVPSGDGDTEHMAREYCHERLARYKQPARYILMDELPRTATGKIDKSALKRA